MKFEKWTDQHDTSVDEEKLWVPDSNRSHELPHDDFDSAEPSSM